MKKILLGHVSKKPIKKLKTYFRNVAKNNSSEPHFPKNIIMRIARTNKTILNADMQFLPTFSKFVTASILKSPLNIQYAEVVSIK
jgi:hypothetical protein